MTLNGVIALILRFSRNSIVLLANYVTVVEDRPIMSVNIVSPFQLFSERELMFMFAICRRVSVCLSVCRLSVVCRL